MELSPQVFAILSAIIEERLGIHYALADRVLLQEKAGARAEEAGFDSLLDYYYFLRYDPAGEQELQALAEALVVRETYLFREFAPLRVLVDDFIAPWAAAGRRPRLWCAAASTGEEPLTLAMLLDARGLLARTELIASDLSAHALERARRGLFGRRSVRSVPMPQLLDRYVRATGDGWAVEPRLLAAIDWRQLNLVDHQAVNALGRFDAILCRNVLIYFSDETTRGVVERLAGALVDDGVLLVGISESLLRHGTAVDGEEHEGVFVYRKAAR